MTTDEEHLADVLKLSTISVAPLVKAVGYKGQLASDKKAKAASPSHQKSIPTPTPTPQHYNMN